MDKRRKVFRTSIKRADALTLYSALNNVTSSQAGSYDKFYALAQFATDLGEYFAFTPEDEAEAEAQSKECLPPIYSRRTVFLYE